MGTTQRQELSTKPLSSEAKVLVAKNPATGEMLKEIPAVDPRSVKAYVNNARDAQIGWSKLTYDQRGKYLLNFRDSILNRIDEIADVISKDNGKTRVEAISMEIFPVLDLISFFATHTARILKDTSFSIGTWNWFLRRSKLTYEPVGVVGVISPWNYPFAIPVGEIVMALMAGNAVILKPSEHTPLISELIGELIESIELPKGLFCVLQGDGSVGSALLDAKVDKVMFTGSVRTGKQIMEKAAQTLTPVTLELGGKDAMIVCHDANLEVAACGAIWGAFANSGQTCSSVERVYVDERVKDEFISLVTKKAKTLRQGCGQQFNTDVGAMTTDFQLANVKAHMDDAIKKGAKIIMGGEEKESPGWFFKPTIVTNVDHSFTCMKEETFGPTMPIMGFETEADAIMYANDSAFGLTATVWSKDTRRAEKIARKLHAGTVMVNDCLTTHGIAQTPWGGVKNSGIGRTHAETGLKSLVNVKHIHINPISSVKGFWWYDYSEKLYNQMKSLAFTLTAPTLLTRLSSIPKIIRLSRMKKL